MVDMMPYTEEAYDLLHQGAIALAQVEANGLRVDTDYCEKAIIRTEKKVEDMQRELAGDPVMKEWKKAFGGKFNFNSAEQLGHVLFERMGYKGEKTEAGGRFRTDEEALEEIELPFVKSYVAIKKQQKAAGTFLKGILRETVDGFLHPFFNLHIARTYRSSSDSPNFQNMPVRDKEIMALIRTAIVPRHGQHLVEIDFSGAEVRVATCYHKDPRMIQYILDPTKDMHRDMASECYLLPASEVSKDVRYCGKNMFVFPQFYGDWYIDCTRSLWEAITRLKLKTNSGLPLLEHLASQGITQRGQLDPEHDPSPGTFEAHVRKVEQNFWNKRFPVYKQWKLDWYEAYRKRGWFKTLTGFICQGYMKRNEAINYPVQGSAFHCLLWALIRLVRVELGQRNMKALIVGQIHDSIVADVPPEELADFLALCKKVMTRLLMKHWDWFNVPMDIEAEVAPVDEPWAKKQKMEIAT